MNHDEITNKRVRAIAKVHKCSVDDVSTAAEALAAPWDFPPDACIVAPVDGGGRGGKMSGAAAGEGASAGAREPGRPQHDPDYEPGDGKNRGPSRGILITIIGALVTAGIATAAVSPGLIDGEPSGLAGDAEPTLSALAPTNITTALPTLDPATSKAAVEDAKSCKAPLAWVTLVKRRGSRGGLVRINSGSYLSPPFQLTDAPQRIAIPYPAPYPTGRGVLSLDGDADEVWFYLTPGLVRSDLKGHRFHQCSLDTGQPMLKECDLRTAVLTEC